MSKVKQSPPKLFLRFFRWYCHPKMQDYIEGDLMEVYEKRLKEFGKRKADRKFIVDVLLLFRPSIIKPAEGYKNLNTYGMYKSYFKIGWRNLVREKGYSMINIGGLALSITCGILVFSLVKIHTSYDNFHENSDRIYRVVTEMHRDGINYTGSVPSPLGEHFRNDFTLSEKVARIYTQSNPLIQIKKGEELIKFREADGIAFTESTFFEIFNFPLLHGNPETVLSEAYTAIVTEKAAFKYFGNNNPVGEVFWLENKIPFTVTGVLKDLPTNTDIKSQIYVSYPSLKTFDPWLSDENNGWGGIRGGMYCYLLIKSGVSVPQVEEALQPYVAKFRGNSKNVHHYKLQPLNDIHFNGRYEGVIEKSKLWTLVIIGSFLLITACLNFINLATAQALKRAKEVGVRKVLGSFKRQIFWQFILETGIIAALGVVVAMVMATLLVPMANDLFKTQIPANLFTDGVTLLFVFSVGVLITLLAGYYPAVILSGFQPVAALKGKLSQQNIGGFNTRRTLIVSQFVISQILIIGMIVVMNQMRYAQQADLGFDKEAIVMIDTGTDSTQTKSNLIKDEIARLLGVEKISLCFTAPASEDDWGNSIKFDNKDEEVNFRTSIKAADADYVSTFNLELVAGRNLTPSDTVKEMLVNESLVHKVGLQPEDALGRIISANGGSMKGPIVGVVKDFHDKSFHQEISAILITTNSPDYSSYAVKLNLNHAKATLAEIEKIWLLQHPDQIFEYEFLDTQIAQFYESEETMLKSIQAFSVIAIFIGSLGLYGLISFMVAQKTKEIGIRKVLGGNITQMLWLLGKEFMRLIFIASFIAAPLGWWFMHRWLEGFKFQISITGWTFVLAIAFTIVITSITISYQAIRAALMNPVDSLRSE